MYSEEELLKMQEYIPTLVKVFENHQHPTDTCGREPVIPDANFEDLSEYIYTRLDIYTEVEMSQEEFEDELQFQKKRFSACGANFSDRFGVIRKNPVNGWGYMVDLITKKPQESPEV